jgi:two-component system, LytTR family, response regulator
MNEYLFFKQGTTFSRIRIDSIRYIIASRKYVKIYTADKTYLPMLTMGYLEQLLKRNQFCRIHKSYLISLAHLTSFNQKSVFIGETVIPLGRVYKEIFKQTVHSFPNEILPGTNRLRAI